MKKFNIMFSCLIGIIYIFFFRISIIIACEILCILCCRYSKSNYMDKMFEHSIITYGIAFFGIAIRNILKMNYSPFMIFAIFEMVFIFISVFVTLNCLIMYFIQWCVKRRNISGEDRD